MAKHEKDPPSPHTHTLTHRGVHHSVIYHSVYFVIIYLLKISLKCLFKLLYIKVQCYQDCIFYAVELSRKLDTDMWNLHKQ